MLTKSAASWFYGCVITFSSRRFYTAYQRVSIFSGQVLYLRKKRFTGTLTALFSCLERSDEPEYPSGPDYDFTAGIGRDGAFTLNQFSQTALVHEIQDSSQEISKAVQLSIADLTSETETSRLSDYFESARQKGINEINIINSEGEIVDSTNPEKIGKLKDLKNLKKVSGPPQERRNRERFFHKNPTMWWCLLLLVMNIWAMCRLICC